MPEIPLDLNPQDDDQKTLAAVVHYYHATLKTSPDAIAYPNQRGIAPTAVDHFRIGFSDRSLGTHLPDIQLKAGRLIRTRLQQLGLFRSSGHEHFRGSLTFPIPAADGSGRIVNIYGRKILDGHLRKGTDYHTHLNDRREGVWNVEAFTTSKEIVLCGSLFDALTFWTHGYRNVTTMFGWEGLTGDHLAAFTEFGVKRVITPCTAVVQKLLDAGLEVFSFNLPLNQDVNIYARSAADPATALGDLLRAAGWEGKGRPVTVAGPVPTVDQLLTDDDGDDQDPEDVEQEGDDTETPTVPVNAVHSVESAEEVTADPAPVPVLSRTASPVPEVPPTDDVTVTDTEVVMVFGTRRYRVRGRDKNTVPGVLKINLMASNGVGLFTDSFDLYSAKSRASFIEQAAAELNVEPATVKKDIGKVLLKLEELQDAALTTAKAGLPAHPEMSAADRDDALSLLRDPALLDRIAADFSIVGTRTNKLTAYLAAVSRKLDRPLGVVVQSASAAGKTTLVDAVLELVPPEDRIEFSAVTGQGLYYLSDGDLRHKVLSIAEEAGASKASYALKLLQSEGRLTIASTGKEATTGRLVTQTYTVEGPVALFTTTTSSDVDEELLNRCLLLTVDETRDQTRAVHQIQRRRETLAGLLAGEEHERVVRLHRNAQRLLRNIRVVNPFAERLTFSDTKARTRRDHAKYLTLIRAVALLHQHQRPVQTVEHQGRPVEFIEATVDDIRAANELAVDVLGRCLDDLPPQTRTLLGMLDELVADIARREGLDRTDVRFSRKTVREKCGWGDTQLKVHLKRLADLEFVAARRDRLTARLEYELVCEMTVNGRATPGLIDVTELRRSG